MSTMTIRNSVNKPAQVTIKQGGLLLARVGLGAHGKAEVVSCVQGVVIDASTTFGGSPLEAASLALAPAPADVTAEVAEPGEGDFQFRLVQSAPTELSAIVLSNTWREPVRFQLKAKPTGAATTIVIDANGTETVGLGGDFYLFAIVNGITTAVLTVADPSATVTITQDESGLYFLEVKKG
jgi:hypothetical protein